jgi:hypothetical protein
MLQQSEDVLFEVVFVENDLPDFIVQKDLYEESLMCRAKLDSIVDIKFQTHVSGAPNVYIINERQDSFFANTNWETLEASELPNYQRKRKGIDEKILVMNLWEI